MDIGDMLSSILSLEELVIYEDIKRKLKLNKDGKPLIAVFKDILSSENLCMARALAQFLFVEPVAYTLVAYLSYQRDNYSSYLDTLEELSSMPLVEDEWIYNEVFDILSNIDRRDTPERIKSLLERVKKEKTYRYKIPIWAFSDIIKKVNRMLEEKGFSQESISFINESSATCAGLGTAAKYLFFEGRESLNENAFVVYINALSYIAIRSGLPVDDRRKALNEVVTFLRRELVDIEESPILYVLELDGRLTDRSFWNMAKEVLDTEELAVMISRSKTENPEVRIPIKGFEDPLLLIRSAVLPLLCKKCEYAGDIDEKTRLRLIEADESMWFLAPFFLAVKDEENIYPSFRTLPAEFKSDIIASTIEYSFEEDRKLLKPVLKKLLKFSNEKLRKEFEQEVDAI